MDGWTMTTTGIRTAHTIAQQKKNEELITLHTANNNNNVLFRNIIKSLSQNVIIHERCKSMNGAMLTFEYQNIGKYWRKRNASRKQLSKHE